MKKCKKMKNLKKLIFLHLIKIPASKKHTQ